MLKSKNSICYASCIQIQYTGVTKIVVVKTQDLKNCVGCVHTFASIVYLYIMAKVNVWCNWAVASFPCIWFGKTNKPRLIQGIMSCSFPASKLTINVAVTAAARQVMQTGRVTQHWQGSLSAVYSWPVSSITQARGHSCSKELFGGMSDLTGALKDQEERSVWRWRSVSTQNYRSNTAKTRHFQSYYVGWQRSQPIRGGVGQASVYWSRMIAPSTVQREKQWQGEIVKYIYTDFRCQSHELYVQHDNVICW